jgi:cytochrome c-type biogenesis protein CcmH
MSGRLLASARWLAGFLFLVVLLAGGVVGPSPARAEPIDDQVRQIAKQLRCPICESVSVADSPADLAVQMRALIRKKLEAGESEQQIVDYFVATYGDSVLLEPPRRGLGWVVWLGPVLALALGGVVLYLVLRVWVRARAEGAVEPAGGAREPVEVDSSTARAREELEAIRRGVAR